MDQINALDTKSLVLGAAAGLAGGFLLSKMLTPSRCLRHEMVQSNGEMKEFSVVYTDRALNLMSLPFQQVMRDISTTLCDVYNANQAVIIPGSGTYGMEACARQFGNGEKVLIIRNGYFSFRWSDIFDVCGGPTDQKVLMASTDEKCATPKFSPPALETVLAEIKQYRPKAVFAPHVETSTGIILSDDYITKIGEAVHEVGGVFILDCIASGTVWVDMKACNVDALISAPQKGWSGPACCAMVMLSELGRARVAETSSDGFACNLKQWLLVMDYYTGVVTENNPGFKYYTTLPTDALRQFRNALMETKQFGFANAQTALKDLGKQVRDLMAANGFSSVAAPAWASPGVVVSYAETKDMVKRFKSQKIQIAGGVPFKINEQSGLITFRIGLFGLDKIRNIPQTVNTLKAALEGMKQ
jgi:aspartate aminotransferase-like enzyme